jgi:hypothetical protein
MGLEPADILLPEERHQGVDLDRLDQVVIEARGPEQPVALPRRARTPDPNILLILSSEREEVEHILPAACAFARG